MEQASERRAAGKAVFCRIDMIDYLYDGTFEGILTCIYHNYYTDKASGIFRKDEYQSTLLGGCMDIKTDPVKATIVYEAIEKKISSYDLRRIYGLSFK